VPGKPIKASKNTFNYVEGALRPRRPNEEYDMLADGF
jgi:hypothetical protein